ncbi:MAG TPA: hypothetical protein VF468_20870 [Actinomycetota bacterium]|nr:hypothetical protein [Actinomycetota bacterium]
MLVGVVQGLAQFSRRATGVGEFGAGPVDDPGGVDVVVGPDPAAALFGGEPAAELLQ